MLTMDVTSSMSTSLDLDSTQIESAVLGLSTRLSPVNSLPELSHMYASCSQRGCCSVR